MAGYLHGVFDPIQIGADVDINSAAVDRFTLVHAAVGGLLAMLGVSGAATGSIAVGWEVLEDKLKDWRPDLFPHPSHDSKANALYDVAALLVGWKVVKWLGRRS